MTPQDFAYLQTLLKTRSGLVLAGDKQYLAESRLIPLARRLGMAGVSDLVTSMKAGTESVIVNVVEAMTTNETFFFRDNTPFDQFREVVLPSLLEARKLKKSLRIWCAASSTGQEPYSLAMILKEMSTQLLGWRIEIIATDISSPVLEKSKAGIFSQFEVQRGLPVKLLVKYFTQVGEGWQIAPEIRSMVQFRQLNLLTDFAHLGTFDVIFCRNVLIYFDAETKTNVFKRLNNVIERDGFLLLGAAETVVGLTTAFSPHKDRRGLYGPTQALRVVSPPLAPAAGAGIGALQRNR